MYLVCCYKTTVVGTTSLHNNLRLAHWKYRAILKYCRNFRSLQFSNRKSDIKLLMIYENVTHESILLKKWISQNAKQVQYARHSYVQVVINFPQIVLQHLRSNRFDRRNSSEGDHRGFVSNGLNVSPYLRQIGSGGVYRPASKPA
jgi:hypothetical protein